MDSKNILIGILTLTTIGAGVFAWQQHQRAGELDAHVAKLTKTASERSSRENQRRGSSPSTAATAAVTSDAPRPDDGPRTIGGRQEWQGRPNNLRAVFESPQAAKLMASQQRGMLDSRYAPLFKSLGLAPDQLAKMKDLMVEKQNAARDVMAVAREQGLDFRTNRDEVQQLIQQAGADVDASIAAVIGQDKFAQYQNFDQTQAQRAVTNQIEQRLSYTAEPMTSAQSEQLVSLLAANTPASSDNAGPGNRVFVANFSGPAGGVMMGGGPGMMPGLNVTGGVAITDQVIKDAQSFLSATQVDALRQMQTEQADQKKLQQLIMEGSNSVNATGNTDQGGQRTRNRGRGKGE